METQAADTEPMEEADSVVILDEPRLREIVANGSLHFDDWTSLISAIDAGYPDDIEKLSLVYDSFLAEFPLCYGYWRKYAAHKMRLCAVDAAIEVFERAVESVTYSVDLWVDYCAFASSVFEDPSDVCRLFKRGLSFVGKDYLSHTLWDKYIEFEFSRQNWISLAQIYIQTQRFPTKKLHRYYDSFKRLVGIWLAEMESYGGPNSELPVEDTTECEISTSYKQDDISCIIKDLLDPSIGLARFKALKKYISMGEHFYQEASQLNEKINCFENRIRRSYFHVNPLDNRELENWHQYLDFAELHRDFDWTVKLYERCLIPCADYPDFWMRYVEFMESKGAREIANFALARATQTFLKRVSVIHQFSARFKEHLGDATDACAAFSQCDIESDTDFVANVVMKANMERRLGNFVAASNTYKEALEMAAVIKEKSHTIPALYVHFSQLKYMTTGGEDVAIDVLTDGIKQLPYCKLLIEELIKFAMMHGGPRHINLVDSIIAGAILPQQGVSQGLSEKDGEDIARLYLEFVDLCGTVLDIRRAWNRHIRLFPHSVRISFSPATATKKWKIALEAAEESPATLPHQASGDCDSNFLGQSASQEEMSSLPENYEPEPHIDQVSDQKLLFLENDHMLSGWELDKKSPLLENHNSVNQAAANLRVSEESNNSIQDSMHRVSPQDSEPIMENTSKPNSPILMHQITDNADGAATLLECSKEKDFQQEYYQESEQDLKPPSLGRLSLDPRYVKSSIAVSPQHDNTEAPAPSATIDEYEDFKERSLSNRSMLKKEAFEEISISDVSMPENGRSANADQSISSPVRTQATNSSHINVGNSSPSTCASNQKTTAQSPLLPQMLVDSGKNLHQKSNFDRFHRGSRYGSRGHSNKRLHQQRQRSPQKQYPRTERSSQVPTSQNYPSQQGSQAQVPYPTSIANPNVTIPQPWSMQNVQQQSPSPAHQSQPVQSTACPQVRMSQYAMQSDGQQANFHNNQAYNEMWQYYYYQQQLLWQQQQQFQHQQPQQQLPQQQQQLLQQQYQQQVLQLQYLQQQHLQQQQLPHQQQQLQQFQHQQHEQHQQHLLQQQLQAQQLQANQQQHLLYLQQQQQLPQQQPHYLYQQQQIALSQWQKPEEELGQPEQQISKSQDTAAELDRQIAIAQGQVTLLPGSAASGTIEPSASHPQQQSLHNP